MKIIYKILFILLVFSLFSGAQTSEKAHKKLEFLVGAWESKTIYHLTGKEMKGKSSIEWILGNTWLQWKFTAQSEKGSLKVMTLINFNQEKGKYAFYSFNPFDDHPRPHFGDWIAPEILRLEIKDKGGKTQVDFKIKKNGNFDQVHYRINSSGEKIKRGTTRYTKITSLKPALEKN